MMWDHISASADLETSPSPAPPQKQKLQKRENQVGPLLSPKNARNEMFYGEFSPSASMLESFQASRGSLMYISCAPVASSCLRSTCKHSHFLWLGPCTGASCKTRGSGGCRDGIYPHVDMLLSPTEAYCGAFPGPYQRQNKGVTPPAHIVHVQCAH